MKALAPVLAFALASMSVALIWSGVATWWSPRDFELSTFLEQTAVIFALVAVVSALPAFGAYTLASWRGLSGYAVTALSGLVIGAGLFLAIFSGWVSAPRLWGSVQLLGLGGALGCVGGLVFQFSTLRLNKMEAMT